jgi:mRNA interferase MazF
LRLLQTVIVAPLTSSGKACPFRVPCVFEKKQGLIVFDQIRAVDREHVLRRLGAVSEPELDSTLALLRELFEA